MSVIRKFVTTIRNSEQALDVGKDLGEVAIDSILSDKFSVDGVLKEIPILGVFVSLCKAGNEVAAYFFAKNMLAFLAEVDKVSLEERVKFLDENCAGEDGIENVGEVALMILDKLDHPKLAAMLGRAFALMVIGTITKYEFDLYAHIIKILNPYLQKQLNQCYQFQGMMGLDVPAASLLANYGLIDLKNNGMSTASVLNSPKLPQKNDFGQAFYNRIIIGSPCY